ncbi:serine/threonine protein kinase [Nocardiopsis arvandica]|uniref:non-specific serine/threonine protein kinase n=1 Tax=Nocardiopsis sinuspersici TaxID=501010 RepID=A0A7Y9XAY3_9ACTN|nr:protein kinase [Nocardiopsis sinuspersici]NYH52446.1 serine/threonine protein kinase [Nocardiopsis sinuspersici]
MSGSEHASWAPGYESLTVLREGPRARLVRGRRTTSGADVVLKVLPRAAGRAELDHLRDLGGVPGVVPLVDAGTTAEGDLFVVLPFYADGSFSDMLVRRGPAPLQETAAIARSVAAALSAIHGRGLVHDAVSPGNILRAGRTPVLTGFGSVHPIGTAMPPPNPGTDAFPHSPPEALRGEPRSPASDVYRLASTIWTMLVGRPPFAPEDGAALHPRDHAHRVFTEDVPPVTRQDVSRKLRGVLTRALSKAPEERYDSAAAFAAAFEQARAPQTTPSASGTGPQVPPPGTGPQAPHPGTGPQTPPHPGTGPQTPPGTGPQNPPHPGTGPQAPHPGTGPQTPPADPRTASGNHPGPTGGQGSVPPPPYAVHGTPRPPAPPGAHPGTGPRGPLSDPQPPPVPSARLDSARSLRGGPPAPPEDGQAGSRLPASDAGSTAEIMMAKLRGEEISPRIAWSRVEGWSGTAETSRLPHDEPDTGQEDVPEWSVPDEPVRGEARWRKHMHIAVAVGGILVLTAVSGTFAAAGSGTPVSAASEVEEPAEESGAPADEEAGTGPDRGGVVDPESPPEVAAPSGITLTDNLGAVELTWTDNSGGTASFFVLGGPRGHDPLTLARTGPGAVSAQVVTDDTVMEYCFTVVAVEGSSAPAEEVCTTRAADRAEAERLAEEQAAEEAEEEAEEEADPSPGPSPDPSPSDGN